MNEKSVLPDKPSELIRLALGDLAKVEALPEKYQVFMGNWHAPSEASDSCLVCLAGSVMAMSLGAHPGACLSPADFRGMDSNKLAALDHFRNGHVDMAFEILGLENPPFDVAYVQSYHKLGSNEFHLAMERLAKNLEVAGF